MTRPRTARARGRRCAPSARAAQRRRCPAKECLPPLQRPCSRGCVDPLDTSAEDRLGYSSPRFAARLFDLAFIILILPSSSIEPGGKAARGPVRVGGGAGGLAGHVGIERSSHQEPPYARAREGVTRKQHFAKRLNLVEQDRSTLRER